MRPLSKFALFRKIRIFGAGFLKNFERMLAIWSKNLAKNKPKKAILIGKWNFERGL